MFQCAERTVPVLVQTWLERHGATVLTLTSADELMDVALRSRPRVVLFDARDDTDLPFDALARLKRDSYTGMVPSFALVGSTPPDAVAALAAGADEAISENITDAECLARLDALMRSSDRDVNLHPSTRLPGTLAIEHELERRLFTTERFAMCYADLDHFKEFNDRYSYHCGDGVIRLLARLLHDMVKGHAGEEGYIGHIGGDDFVFMIPCGRVPVICSEIVELFDELIPLQYSEQDRRAGYFFGKDRRGQLHRVPLMTLSIGVVTNERRHFTSVSQITQLATEMKGYAKTLTGSVYSVDRRTDMATPTAEQTPPRARRTISMIED